MNKRERKTAFEVMDSAAAMPGNCWGRYRRVAVMEVPLDSRGNSLAPAYIDDRPKNCIRLVETWEKLNVGSTDRCAFEVAWSEAYSLALAMEAAVRTLNDRTDDRYWRDVVTIEEER